MIVSCGCTFHGYTDDMAPIIEYCRGHAYNYDVFFYAKKVMDTLQEYGPSIVPHLLDTDENDGERLRNALRG